MPPLLHANIEVMLMKMLFGADVSFSYLTRYPGDKKIKEIVKDIKPLFNSADFKMLNLENVFGEKEYEPIIKSGPNLISSGKFISFFKELNPQVVGMANNHTGDFGAEPIFYTFDLLEKENIAHIGAGENINAAYRPYVFEKDGVKVSVFAVCENEFGTAGPQKAGSAGFHLGRLTCGLIEEKKKGNKVIVYFHGGNENNPYPSPEKVMLYRHFADIGADSVVAMHTHCPQGYEIYNGCPIIYSMGNFFFPHGDDDKIEALDSTWYFGYLTELIVSEQHVGVQLHPYKFSAEAIELLKGEKLEAFNVYLERISKPIQNNNELQRLFDGWCMISGIEYAKNLTFSPDMLKNGTRQVKHLKNLFGCEAHNELITRLLTLCYEGRAEEAAKTTQVITSLQRLDI